MELLWYLKTNIRKESNFYLNFFIYLHAAYYQTGKWEVGTSPSPATAFMKHITR